MSPEAVVLSWSGGKDSALALARLQADPSVEVAGLLTTVTAGYDRISIHGVRRAFLQAQGRSLGLPIFEVTLEPQSSNEAYEQALAGALTRLRGYLPEVQWLAFGDIFLADVRRYREDLAGALGFSSLFPLWGEPSRALAEEVLERQITARLVCVDTQVLPAAYAGQAYDAVLLDGLPPGIDPCGERGEFHTFVSSGPGFCSSVPYRVGETVLREERFAFCDLLPLAVD